MKEQSASTESPYCQEYIFDAPDGDPSGALSINVPRNNRRPPHTLSSQPHIDLPSQNIGNINGQNKNVSHTKSKTILGTTTILTHESHYNYYRDHKPIHE